MTKQRPQRVILTTHHGTTLDTNGWRHTVLVEGDKWLSFVFHVWRESELSLWERCECVYSSHKNGSTLWTWQKAR